MRKSLILLFAALTLCAGLWAIDNVKYIDAAGVEQTANGVTEITNAFTTTLNGGWYVVYGADVQTGTLICQGAVHLILADGAKLTTTGEGFGQTPPCIQVSGDGNSLTIYGQMVQSGQIVAQGGVYAAGIGGGCNGSGSNITINGGVVTANGGVGAAGIGGGQNGSGSYITINGGVVTANGGVGAAGIGGGTESNGSHITINGGVVTANGGYVAGIGGGSENSSDIYVATNLVVKADRNNPPTEVIYNNGSDLASSLSSKIYVTIDPGSLDKVKTDAIAAINAAIEGVTNETILAIANKAKTDINAAETVQHVISIKATALAQMNALTLAIARADAISAVQAAATDAKTAIDAASSYKAADAIKLDYKAKIDLIVEAAIEAINSDEATTVARVDELRSLAVLRINGRKEEAMNEIAKINDLEDAKVAAIKDITNAREGILNAELNALIDDAINNINKATNQDKIIELESNIFLLMGMYLTGKAEALGSMAEPCTGCTAVEVTDGTTTVTLYNATNVGYIKK